MLSFNITAEWGLTPTDLDWLKNYWVPKEFNVAVENVNFVLAEQGQRLPPDPWAALHVAFSLHLHRSPWHDAVRNSDNAGIYIPNSGKAEASFSVVGGFNRTDIAPADRIEIAWDREFEFQRILSHEFGHMLYRHSLNVGWEYFGHGGYPQIVEGKTINPTDPYKFRIQRLIDKVYAPGRVEYPVTWRYM